MDKQEKSIIIGGVLVTALATGGFTLSQGNVRSIGEIFAPQPAKVVQSSEEERQVASTEDVVLESKEDTNTPVVEEVVSEEKVEDKEVTQPIEEEKSEEEISTENEEVAKENEAAIEDTFDANKVYYAGDIVVYNQKEFRAKWWTKGDLPDEYVNWEEIVPVSTNGIENYARGKHYNQGQVVAYEGSNYEATYWTESVPGTNSSWKIIN